MDIGVNVIQQRQHHTSKLVLSLKQLSLFSSFLALLLDLLSSAGLLPFTVGYTRTIAHFVRFASAPQLVDAIRGRLSSGVLFVFMNTIIVAILATSGCFKPVDDQQQDTSATADSVPAPVNLEEEQEQEQEQEQEHQEQSPQQDGDRQSLEPPERSSSMPQLEDDEDQQPQHFKKAPRKVRRQVSSPAALGTSTYQAPLGTSTSPAALGTSTSQALLGTSTSPAALGTSTQLSQKMRTKAIIVKPKPAKSASFPARGAVAAKGFSSVSDSFNLVTCEQEVFNQIVESYIDKFRQDMRQQEMQSVINGQLFASRAPNW